MFPDATLAVGKFNAIAVLKKVRIVLGPRP